MRLPNSSGGEVIAASATAPRVMHFAGPRRSGNHVLINWISEGINATGRDTLHLNDIYSAFYGHEAPTNLDADTISERIAAKDPDITILSYEDLAIDAVQGLSQYRTFATSSLSIVLLRDFPNLMASRI